jgi:hypothetical protein
MRKAPSSESRRVMARTSARVRIRPARRFIRIVRGRALSGRSIHLSSEKWVEHFTFCHEGSVRRLNRLASRAFPVRASAAEIHWKPGWAKCINHGAQRAICPALRILRPISLFTDGGLSDRCFAACSRASKDLASPNRTSVAACGAARFSHVLPSMYYRHRFSGAGG